MEVAIGAYGECPRGLAAAGNSSCKRPLLSPGCTSVLYRSGGVGYSQVCGNIHAFRSGRPDGFFHIERSGNEGLEANYVD